MIDEMKFCLSCGENVEIVRSLSDTITIYQCLGGFKHKWLRMIDSDGVPVFSRI